LETYLNRTRRIGGVTAVPFLTKGMSDVNGNNRNLNYFLGLGCIGTSCTRDTLVAAFDEYGNGLNHQIAGVTTILPDGVWHHAATAYDSTSAIWNLYLDGRLEAVARVSVTQPVLPRSNSIQYAALATTLNSCGTPGGTCGGSNSGPPGYFAGVLDEARVWNIARTQMQIQSTLNQEVGPDSHLIGHWSMNEGQGTLVSDTSGTSHNGTTVNGPAWVQGAPSNITLAPDPPVLISPPNGSLGVGGSATLSVKVSEPGSTSLTVQFYGRPCPPDFTVVALPDTQYYSQDFPAIYSVQTQWIVDNRSSQNIVFVSHLGDIVNTQWDLTQWNNASASMGKLETPGIPYGVQPGNTDGAPTDTTQYNQYFGVSRFQGRSYYGGNFGSTNDYNYELFSASGLSFIAVHLSYTPSSGALTWANGVLKSNSNLRAIVTTHDLLDVTTPTPNFSSNGAAIWNALKGNSNLFMMLGGHLDTYGRRQDTGTNGNTVYSLRSDYQTQPNGGDGWLQIMQFSPASNQITVKTYSPYLGQYWTPDNTLTVPYNMGPGCGTFQLLGTVTTTSGSQASYNWNNLQGGVYYTWYVTVSDGTNTMTGPVWWFLPSGSTAVTVSSFTGHAASDQTGNHIALNWATLSNSDVAFSLLAALFIGLMFVGGVGVAKTKL
ncbi:MAG TPA: LamG-like jellyroll fold domain-containing protein, partial [Anaerolineae bacterium]